MPSHCHSHSSHSVESLTSAGRRRHAAARVEHERTAAQAADACGTEAAAGGSRPGGGSRLSRAAHGCRARGRAGHGDSQAGCGGCRGDARGAHARGGRNADHLGGLHERSFDDAWPRDAGARTDMDGTDRAYGRNAGGLDVPAGPRFRSCVSHSSQGVA